MTHGARCNLCDSRIVGDRYKCTDCPDFDTCSSCFAITVEQHPFHSFVRVTKPDDYMVHDCFSLALFPLSLTPFQMRRKPERIVHCATCDGKELCSLTLGMVLIF